LVVQKSWETVRRRRYHGIKAKLYSEPLLKSASIDVIAKDGIVTLTGQVPDELLALRLLRHTVI